MGFPKISVCVPTYNKASMLEENIKSLLRQNYYDSEFVIVDDASTDKTCDTTKAYASRDNRIRYIRNETNIGFARNLRKCLKIANGEYLLILADDDYLFPNAIERYVKVFESFPGVGVALSNRYQVDATGKKCTYVMKYFPKDKVFSRGREALETIWPQTTFISGIGIRKVYLSGFDDHFPLDMIYPQLEMLGRMLLKVDGYGLSSFLVAARVHEGQFGNKVLADQERDETEHVFYEIPLILDKILGSSDGKTSVDRDKIVDALIKGAYRVMVLNRLIERGRSAAVKTLRLGFKTYPKLKSDYVLLTMSVLSLMLPRRALYVLKEGIRKVILNTKYREDYKKFFKSEML